MAAVVAAEPRSPPAAIDALSRFVVQPAGVDREALHEKSGSPADRIAAMLGEFFQELLMAEERVRRLRRFERLKEAKLFFWDHESLV